MIDEPRSKRFSDPFFALLGVRVVIWLWVVRTVVPALFIDPFKLAHYHDEHFYFAHEDAARVTISQFSQLPAWNPYYCGGIPGIANPQDSTFSPEMLLKLFYGVGPGRRLGYLLLFVLGMEGVYRLARRLDASAIGAILAGAVFATSGFFLDVMRLGWLNFFTFELVPWVALAYLHGLRSWPWRVGGGLFIAWMVLAGGLYTVPYTVLMLMLLTAMTTGEIALGERRDDRPRWHAPLATFVAIGVIAACVSAVKLLPMLKVIVDFPRVWEGGEAQPVSEIFSRLTGRPAPYDGQPGYIGQLILMLGLLGATFDKNGARVLALTILFFALALGDFADYAPNTLLHKLPVFGQLRFPHRFVVMVALFSCIGAAIAIGKIEDFFLLLGRALRDATLIRSIGELGPMGKLCFGAVGAVIALKLSLFVWDGFSKDSLFESLYVMDAPLARRAEFHQSRGNRWDAQVWPRASLGTLQCFEETAFPMSGALTGDAKQEERPIDPNHAKVTREKWTPNEITLHVVSYVTTSIVVNQNYHRAWRTNVGKVYARDGLLALEIPPGTHTIVLRYRDRLMRTGLGISVVSLLAIVVLAVREARLRIRAFRARWDAIRP